MDKGERHDTFCDPAGRVDNTQTNDTTPYLKIEKTKNDFNNPKPDFQSGRILGKLNCHKTRTAPHGKTSSDQSDDKNANQTFGH
jgi:hypothetical protein